MARQGRPGPALAIAAIGSFFAGTVGTLLIALAGPPLAEVALKFGSPEYFSLMLMGLVAAAVLAQGDIVKSLAMVVFGLLLGIVGTDVNTGVQRFSFGVSELTDGIGFIVVAVGVFAIGEIIGNLGETEKRAVFTSKVRNLWPTADDFRRCTGPILRGTGIGAFFGVLPGTGPAIASFASYMVEKKLADDPSRFGQGAIEGVAGPESANNAASTGAFVPMLALGIPTGPVTAVLIAALLLHGIPAGPTLVNDHPQVFWGFVASMYVGNLMLLALNLPLVGLFVNVLRVRYYYLYPLIIMFCIIGVYEVNNSIIDVWIMLIMGVIGYLLRKFDFDPAPLVLGLVITPTFELSLRQSLVMSSGDWMIFFQRPIAAGLFAVSGALLLLAAYSAFTRTDWRDKLAEAETGDKG
jgi:putative tricarboxylic transport membrane protein